MRCKLVTLGSLCKKVVSGGTPKSTISDYYNGGIPWLNTKEVHFNRIYETEKTISALGLQKSSAKWIPPHCVIVAMYGATAGNVAVNLIPLTTNQACCNLEIDETKADYRYIYYFLKANYMKLSSLANGGAQQNLSATLIKDFTVAVPSLRTQNDISDILWLIDDKIELNNKINENLERQAQSLFKAWFVDFIPFGGTIPSEWNWVAFSEFLIPRNEKSSDSTLPLYSITDSGIYLRTEKFKKNLSMTNTKNKVVHVTDLVFGMSREILNWGVMHDAIGRVSAAYNVYIVKPEIDTRYLESYMKANIKLFHDLIKPASREGQSIDRNALMQKQLLVPPSSVLAEYYVIENSLTNQISIIKDENMRLSQIRDSLLPKLMSGEIDVENVQI